MTVDNIFKFFEKLGLIECLISLAITLGIYLINMFNIKSKTGNIDFWITIIVIFIFIYLITRIISYLFHKVVRKISNVERKEICIKEMMSDIDLINDIEYFIIIKLIQKDNKPILISYYTYDSCIRNSLFFHIKPTNIRLEKGIELIGDIKNYTPFSVSTDSVFSENIYNSYKIFLDDYKFEMLKLALKKYGKICNSREWT